LAKHFDNYIYIHVNLFYAGCHVLQPWPNVKQAVHGLWSSAGSTAV